MMSKQGIFVITFWFLIVTIFVPQSGAHSWGAPASVCDSMTPRHPGSPQSGKLPVEIAVNPRKIKGGEITKIEIKGSNDNQEFKGILIQVRNEDDQAVGTFELSKENQTILKTIDCNSNKGSAVTHKNSKPKSRITLDWRAPKSAGTYKIAVTIVESKLRYWVAKNVQTIQVN